MQLGPHRWQATFIKQYSSSALLLQLGMAGLSLQCTCTNSANLLQWQSALSQTGVSSHWSRNLDLNGQLTYACTMFNTMSTLVMTQDLTRPWAVGTRHL